MEQKRCQRCGTYNDAQNAFCRYCGARFAERENGTGVPPIDPTLYGGAPTGGFSSPDPNHPPMRWYNFLINFALFAGAILNFMEALEIFFGIYHVDEKLVNYTETLYANAPALRVLDYCYAGVLLLLCAFMLYTRFSLAGYRKFAPQLLISLYIISGLIGAIYTMLTLLLGSGEVTEVYFAATVVAVVMGIASNLVIAFLNHIYFSKRKHLFTK